MKKTIFIKQKQTKYEQFLLLDNPNNPKNNHYVRLKIQKEFLQNRLTLEILNYVLLQQPDELFSEIVLADLLLFHNINKETAFDFLLKSDPSKFAYQYAKDLRFQNDLIQQSSYFENLLKNDQHQYLMEHNKYLSTYQVGSVIKIMFLKSHQQFLMHSLNIVLKNIMLKQQIYTNMLTYDQELSVEELIQITTAYSKFQSLVSFYLRKIPNFIITRENMLLAAMIKQSEQQNKNIENLLNNLLECDDKQKIIEILLLLNFSNDTILNLGILLASDELQLKEEQLFFEKWTQSKAFRKKLWFRFSTLVQSKLIKLENLEFVVCNLNFSQPLLIKALFSLVRRHTSNFIIENAASKEIKQYLHYFLAFPDFFKIFFIDYSQLLDEDYNNLILKSLNVTLVHIEKTRSLQEIFNFKAFLSQFLVQCAQKISGQTKPEISIYQFLQQLLIKDKNLILQFVVDLENDQIESAIKNIDCLHIVADFDLLSSKIINKAKLYKVCLALQEKHKKDIVEKSQEDNNEKKINKQNTNYIMTAKEERFLVQLY